MMRIYIDEKKRKDIEEKHWEYIEKHVMPEIEELNDKKIKEFLSNNLEVIIKGTKVEWNKDIIPKYKNMFGAESETQEDILVRYFVNKGCRNKREMIEEIKGVLGQSMI